MGQYKANNSENCRTCHTFTKDVVAKQKDFVRPMRAIPRRRDDLHGLPQGVSRTSCE
jgi:nitrate/TMAO reductase-like tetraheme cytochrome c subunit